MMESPDVACRNVIVDCRSGHDCGRALRKIKSADAAAHAPVPAHERHHSALTRAEAAPVLPEALLRRFDAPGPRYTSYPTADRFVEAFGADDLRQALQQRAAGRGGRRHAAAVAVRAHPVLRLGVLLLRLQQGHHQAPRARPAEYLRRAGRARSTCTWRSSAPGQAVSQLHFGGGSPTFLSDAELQRADRRRCGAPSASTPGAEMSIEVDPRTVTPERLAHLARAGLQPHQLRRAGLRPATCRRPCTACSPSTACAT